MKNILSIAAIGAIFLGGNCAALAQSTAPMPQAAVRALGDNGDNAYTGTGNASIDAVLKGLYNQFSSGLTLKPGTAAIGSVSVTSLPAIGGSVAVTSAPSILPTPVTITATSFPLTANSDQLVLSANPTRKYLAIFIQPANCAMNLGFGAAAAVGIGLTYGFNSVVGYGDVWASGAIPTNAMHVMTAQAGCTGVVREGN